MGAITRPARTSLRRGASSALAADAPRVSVVIPTFNRAELLGRAIRSVLAQTFRDFELIVVSDGSQDNTADVVSAIADARVTLVHLPVSGGPAKARNAGIARSRGEWVAFLDDDDEWLPTKLEAQLAEANGAADVGVVYCRMCVQTPEEFRRPQAETDLPCGEITDDLLSESMIVMPSAFMVRRAALLQVDGFDESMNWAEDRDLWLRLAQAGQQFAGVKEPLIVYHIGHKGRLSMDWMSVCSLARYQRRWGRLEKQRLSPIDFRVDRARRRRWVEKANRKQVKRLLRNGRRGRAWRYAATLFPTIWTLPWVLPFIAQSLAITVFGRNASRLPGMPSWDARQEERRDRDVPLA